MNRFFCDLNNNLEELKNRITKEEFFNYLSSLFPDNNIIEKFYPNSKSKLPPLKQINPNIKTESEVSKSTDDSKLIINNNNKKSKGPLSFVPARNSKMLSLNEKYTKGLDGKYYYKEINSEYTKVPNMFGNVNESDPVNVSTAFDFQPYMPSNSIKSKESNIPHPLGPLRGHTPIET